MKKGRRGLAQSAVARKIFLAPVITTFPGEVIEHMMALTDLCSIFRREWNIDGQRSPHEMQKKHWPVLFPEQLQLNQ